MGTVREMGVGEIDKELAQYVPAPYLAVLAGRGLRGELVFAVPSVLATNPHLLGYYRLLLGFSQKAFYTREFGLSGFANMENKGHISDPNKNKLPLLCTELVKSACSLLDGLNADNLSSSFIDDLTLLTLGPQLRGGANVRRGMEGIITVFNTVHEIVRPSVVSSRPNCIELQNAARRKVLIEFASDPDIRIREQMTTGRFRNIIAIEVKAGQDFSNIHNRIGEAEKSHQKAKLNDYVECWTVVNVDRIDINMARKESPSSNRFYLISNLVSPSNDEYQDFRDRIVSLTGISDKKVRKQKKRN